MEPLYNELIIVLLVLIFFSGQLRQSRANRATFILVCIVIFGLVSAFRFQNYHSDFLTNYQHMLEIKYLSWSQALKYSNEFGHQILRKIISAFTDNPQWYFVVTGFFIVSAFFVFIYRYSTDIYGSALLFIAVGGYFVSHNITRQYIAIGLCVLSIKFILNRNPLKFFLIVLIACSFHVSAVVFIVLYFLANLNVSKKVLAVYFVIGIAIYSYFYRILAYAQTTFHFFEDYGTDSYGMSSSNILNIVFPLLVLVLCLTGYKSNKDRMLSQSPANAKAGARFNNLIAHMSIIQFLCVLASVTNVLMMSRIALYFSGATIMLPFILEGFQSKKMIKFIMLTLALISFLAYNYYGKLCPTPYTPFWQFQ
jgi:hypothetical protein